MVGQGAGRGSDDADEPVKSGRGSQGVDRPRPLPSGPPDMLAQLAGVFIALSAALVLASFAKAVLVRTPSQSSESNAHGSASGLSLEEKRNYEQQLLRNRKQQQQPSSQASSTPQTEEKSASASEPKSVMQPARTDPFTMEHLKQFDGADPSKPIYVAIKGAPRFPPLLACPLLTLPPSGRTRHCF